MSQRKKNKFILVLFLSLISGNIFPGIENINRLTEQEKIQRLIAYVRSLKGSVFIRNGSEHSPDEAAKHMELKLRKAGSKIKTATEFIVYCASKSTVTGKDYLVRLNNGRTVKSIDLMTEELKRIEKENR